jgi:mRNA interferase RelE/StbE
VTERYHVTWSRDALKNVKGFDLKTRERIFRATELLSDHPHPPASKKLTGFADLFRVRVGDYRIVYRVHDAELIIVVVSARHRRVAYRNLSN